MTEESENTDNTIRGDDMEKKKDAGEEDEFGYTAKDYAIMDAIYNERGLDTVPYELNENDVKWYNRQKKKWEEMAAKFGKDFRFSMFTYG